MQQRSVAGQYVRVARSQQDRALPQPGTGLVLPFGTFVQKRRVQMQNFGVVGGSGQRLAVDQGSHQGRS